MGEIIVGANNLYYLCISVREEIGSLVMECTLTVYCGRYVYGKTNLNTKHVLLYP